MLDCRRVEDEFVSRPFLLSAVDGLWLLLMLLDFSVFFECAKILKTIIIIYHNRICQKCAQRIKSKYKKNKILEKDCIPIPMSNRKKCLLYGRNKKTLHPRRRGPPSFLSSFHCLHFTFPEDEWQLPSRTGRTDSHCIFFFFAVG
jgi:hypothetical protein